MPPTNPHCSPIGRENVVVVHGGSGQEAEFDLRVRRLESFAGPAAGSDRNERLIDRPGDALLIDIGMKKGGDALLLIRLQAKIYRERDDGDDDQNDADRDNAPECRRRKATPAAPVPR